MKKPWHLASLFSSSSLRAWSLSGCFVTGQRPRVDEARPRKKPSDFPAAANVLSRHGRRRRDERGAVKGQYVDRLEAGNEAFWDYLANHSFGTLIW